MLTRATAVCAACFFTTSLILGVMAKNQNSSESILSQVELDVPVVEDVIEELPVNPVVPISE